MILEELISLCKRRGFVYQASAIYGGLQGFFDYGPLGVELKNNIKNAWWKEIVHMRSDVYGLDSAIIMNKSVLNYSGHIDTFHDALIDCKECKTRFREDEMKDLINDRKCPKCGSKNLSEKRDFNLMMQVNLGPTHSTQGFLRPETAQGVFINFKNVCDSFSCKLPFGIAQIGKAFRNEITPRNFLFRVREFEQMELEYFIDAADSAKYFDYWVEKRVQWWNKMGVKQLRLLQQSKEELSHYSSATTDISFEFGHGFEEIEGIANRGDFDLGSHTKAQSQFSIKANVKQNNESLDKLALDGVVPSLIETSAGLERAFLAILTSAYHEEEVEGEKRIVLKLAPALAPIKAAIIPLARNKEEIVNYSNDLFNKLKEADIFPIVLEAGGNIGKCYRKHDEVGTPFCITVDFETIENDTVTVRNRDTMQQVRMKTSELAGFLFVESRKYY